MQHPFIQRHFFKMLSLVVLFSTMAFSSKAGGDMYEIYLNNKLLVKQYMTQPLSLESLPLTQANINDRLVIRYSHCGQIGKGRSVSLKDANGNVVRTWKFADAKGADAGMVIPVKEILQLQSNNNRLTLVYSSHEIPKGQQLTSLGFGKKDVGKL